MDRYDFKLVVALCAGTVLIAMALIGRMSP